jgi:hypothetical protein
MSIYNRRAKPWRVVNIRECLTAVPKDAVQPGGWPSEAILAYLRDGAGLPEEAVPIDGGMCLMHWLLARC